MTALVIALVMVVALMQLGGWLELSRPEHYMARSVGPGHLPAQPWFRLKGGGLSAGQHPDGVIAARAVRTMGTPQHRDVTSRAQPDGLTRGGELTQTFVEEGRLG